MMTNKRFAIGFLLLSCLGFSIYQWTGLHASNSENTVRPQDGMKAVPDANKKELDQSKGNWLSGHSGGAYPINRPSTEQAYWASIFIENRLESGRFEGSFENDIYSAYIGFYHLFENSDSGYFSNIFLYRSRFFLAQLNEKVFNQKTVLISDSKELEEIWGKDWGFAVREHQRKAERDQADKNKNVGSNSKLQEKWNKDFLEKKINAYMRAKLEPIDQGKKSALLGDVAAAEDIFQKYQQAGDVEWSIFWGMVFVENMGFALKEKPNLSRAEFHRAQFALGSLLAKLGPQQKPRAKFWLDSLTRSQSEFAAEAQKILDAMEQQEKSYFESVEKNPYPRFVEANKVWGPRSVSEDWLRVLSLEER